ncbi:hypothetical protein GIR22_03385 [Pseudomonas sp. CCM 7891]|uniref:Dermonecrotic toxin N-terminal domain-containing protein n=1 Tax=Pseudomonas karstica TaxID=1055468 RepID=A0A7X2RNN0_9PSED|nr:DUF6543 domain-containing protein [Pseudomonas karstica]MTD18184.1 hypothetical protein [Pseudomonas karstica]
MKINDAFPSARTAHPGLSFEQSLPVTLGDHPSLNPGTQIRSRRNVSNTVVPLEARRTAQTLVEKGDKEMAIQYAAAMADQASRGAVEGDLPICTSVSTIAPYSTFGRRWSRFNQALKEEPFITFARNNHINTEKFRWSPSSGTLGCMINGKLTTFGKYTPGWEQASAAVGTAAKSLTPTPQVAFDYRGVHDAPLALVGNFYGVLPLPRQADRLSLIIDLLTHESFDSLHTRDSRNTQPQWVMQRRDETVHSLAGEIAEHKGQPLPSQAQTPSMRLDEADQRMARQLAKHLINLGQDPRLAELSRSRINILPVEFSTFHYTQESFKKAISSDAFLEFLDDQKLNPSTVYINPQTGELSGATWTENGFVEKSFSANDVTSQWSHLATDVWPAAKDFAGGALHPVSCNYTRFAHLTHVLSFYGERSTGGNLLESLKQGASLLRNGFTALTTPSEPLDERAHALQEKQKAIKQRFAEQAAPSQTIPETPSAKPVAVVDPVAEIARRQFTAEPSLHSVITERLSAAIKEGSIGSVDFDINHISLAEPDADNPGQYKHTPLLEVALTRIVGDESRQFTADSKLFDSRPRTMTPSPPLPLNVNMAAIRLAMLELPVVLNELYDAAVHKYWEQPAFGIPVSGDKGQMHHASDIYTGSRKALLSDLLRENLQQAGLKQPGLDDLQREAVDTVVRYPEESTRATEPDKSKPIVYTLTTGTNTEATPNLLVYRYVVETNREIILLLEPSGKITPYDSWDEFDKGGHLHDKTQLTGNMFDAQAGSIIDQHLGRTLSLSPSPVDQESSIQPKVQLPDWMNKAGDAERFVLRDLTLQLAGFMQRNKGRMYNSGIADIRSFALKQFNDKLPSPRSYTAEDLEVVFKVPVGSLNSGYIERERMSLSDMLLRNLSGLPAGQIEVFYTPGNVRITELEKEGVLKQLVQDLDVGKNYGELLKRELLDNPATKAERLSLFAQQVPIDLQIKALELAIKGESGFDATGFRFLREILSPEPGKKTAGTQEIVIRPLAFDRKTDGKIDVVESMYLIEPKDPSTGPHILYRPLIADAPLMQFPSREALMDAIQKPGKLQQDILAWFPDDTTRKIYTGSGFTHPNLVIFGFNTGAFFTSSAPANPLASEGFKTAETLQQKLQDGQLMSYLYESNAQSLLTLADAQSTSDEESRWVSLKEGGYLLLNAVLPALRGPGASIGLALQFESILNDLETLSGDDKRKKEAATADLLVNLANSLAHFHSRPHTTSPKTHSTGQLTESRLLSLEPLPRPPSSNRIRLGGPIADVTPIDGDVQTFVDTYNGAERINILAHGSEPSPGQPVSVVGENSVSYSAEDINNELLARGIDIRDYANARALFCYSGHGGSQSFASTLHSITGVPVKGYEGQIITEITNGEFPDDVYQKALETYTAKFPRLAREDIGELAEIDLYENYVNKDILVSLDKQHGTPVEVNIGSVEHPVYTTMKVDYRPVRFGSSKNQPPSKKPFDAEQERGPVETPESLPAEKTGEVISVPKPQKVEVLMGYSHTIEGDSSVLSTRSLTDCSALAVLTDLKDGIYQTRTLMHLTGSNLDYGLLDQDAYQVLEALNESLNKGGKVIFVGGVDSDSTVGMGVVLGQEHEGKKPLLEILRKPGVETTIASSVGVDINADGTFKLIEGTGKGVFNPQMIRSVVGFAQD